MEEKIFIEWDEGLVPTIINIPDNYNGSLVLMLHAHTAEKNHSGFYTDIAKTLATKGIISARFDFPGCGENTLPFRRNSIYNDSQCTKAVYDYITNNYEIKRDQVTILGFSMGSRVALYCLDDVKPSSLVLISPAIEDGKEMLTWMIGEDYLDRYEEAKINGTYTYKDNYGTLLSVSPSFFKDVILSNPKQVIANYTENLAVIYPENDELIDPNIQKEFIKFATSAKSTSLTMINKADHAMGLATQDKTIYNELFDVTIKQLLNIK